MNISRLVAAAKKGSFRLRILGLASVLTGAGLAGGAAPDQFHVYFGTYTGAKSKGIYVSHFNAAAGDLGAPELAAATPNPTYLAAHPNQRFLYAANEISNFKGEKSGSVSGFAVDAASGKLTAINEQSSGGGGPCHLVVDPTGQAALVANYSGGSIAALPVDAQGKLGASTAFIQHTGRGTNPHRQEGPHAHYINVDPSNRVALVCDLGLDQILTYSFDPARRTLSEHKPAFVAAKPGAGPRHLAFDPQGNYAYVINELDSTLVALAYDAKLGSLREVQSVNTLPADFNGQSSTAEVEVHPSGRFVYGSNRGHDSIVVFSRDLATGRLTWVQHISSGGKTPRCFGIDPTGRHLLAANQGSDNVVVFRVDEQSGRLTPTGQSVSVGAPVCVKFIPASTP